MNDLDLTLLKQDIKHRTETNVSFPFRFPKITWFKLHRNGISGIVCLAVAVLLPTLMLSEMKQIAMTPHNLSVAIITILLALYCLTKGIFTLLFQAKETEFGTSVHQYLITSAYNRLYFVYEKLVWLWVLPPILLATLPSFLGWNDSKVYWIIAVSLYIVALLSFSRPLWCKMKRLKEEIQQLNN